jgi:outer membrane protein OmpA-like peptidoglycan-associated protein
MVRVSPRIFGLLGLLALLAGCAGSAPRQEAPVTAPATTLQVASELATAPEPQAAPPKPTVDVENSVFFASADATLDADDKAKLVLHATRLKADPKLVVTLVGHTDHLGSPSYNLAIADKRIDAVFAQLRAHGVPARQIRRYGMGGETAPINCRSAACRQQMRRVDLVYEAGEN